MEMCPAHAVFIYIFNTCLRVVADPATRIGVGVVLEVPTLCGVWAICTPGYGQHSPWQSLTSGSTGTVAAAGRTLTHRKIPKYY